MCPPFMDELFMDECIEFIECLGLADGEAEAMAAARSMFSMS